MIKGNTKLLDWKGARLIKLLDERSDTILTTIAKRVKANIRAEVPVDTGNLRDATVIGDVGEVDSKRGLNVGTDEEQAPYAPYVYWPAGKHGLGTKTGRSRRYKGNDWIRRAEQKTLSQSANIINQIYKELNGISI